VNDRAIASLLAQFGYLEAEETALDTYNHVCCLSGTIADSALLGMLLVQCQRAILPEHRRTVPHDHLRFVPGICTFRSAGRTPTKSGSGALISVVPVE